MSKQREKRQRSNSPSDDEKGEFMEGGLKFNRKEEEKISQYLRTTQYRREATAFMNEEEKERQRFLKKHASIIRELEPFKPESKRKGAAYEAIRNRLLEYILKNGRLKERDETHVKFFDTRKHGFGLKADIRFKQDGFVAGFYGVWVDKPVKDRMCNDDIGDERVEWQPIQDKDGLYFIYMPMFCPAWFANGAPAGSENAAMRRIMPGTLQTKSRQYKFRTMIIQALTPIEKGNEILLYYGEEYWNQVEDKKNGKKEEKKEEKKVPTKIAKKKVRTKKLEPRREKKTKTRAPIDLTRDVTDLTDEPEVARPIREEKKRDPLWVSDADEQKMWNENEAAIMAFKAIAAEPLVGRDKIALNQIIRTLNDGLDSLQQSGVGRDIGTIHSEVDNLQIITHQYRNQAGASAELVTHSDTALWCWLGITLYTFYRDAVRPFQEGEEKPSITVINRILLLGENANELTHYYESNLGPGKPALTTLRRVVQPLIMPVIDKWKIIKAT